MRWILVERKPDVIYAGGQETYLGDGDAEVSSSELALTFETREAAEAHRRTLKHRYFWVAITAPK